MLPRQFVPLCGDCGPGHVVQNCPLRNPPTLKTGPVALVNLMRVIPNPNKSLCGTSETSKMIQEEVYDVTRAQKAQVSIHKSQSAEPRNSSPQLSFKVKKYPDPRRWLAIGGGHKATNQRSGHAPHHGWNPSKYWRCEVNRQGVWRPHTFNP